MKYWIGVDQQNERFSSRYHRWYSKWELNRKSGYCKFFLYQIQGKWGKNAIEPIIEQARAAFHANAQKGRADRYRIVFKAGWVKVGRPFMVRSQEEEFVVWVEGGGVEDFRLDQIASMELLPHPEKG